MGNLRVRQPTDEAADGSSGKKGMDFSSKNGSASRHGAGGVASFLLVLKMNAGADAAQASGRSLLVAISSTARISTSPERTRKQRLGLLMVVHAKRACRCVGTGADPGR